MNCPHCGRNIPTATIAKHLAAKGGKAGKGTKKRSELNSAAAKARWAKEKKTK